jgi:hypothetical protein
VTYEYWYVGPELPLVVALFVVMLLARELGHRVGRPEAGPGADPVRPQVNVVGPRRSRSWRSWSASR